MPKSAKDDESNDSEQLQACEAPTADQAPDGFWKGIGEFNKQEFFECHETLEAVWNQQTGPERELTQGIIQVAVAYYHLLRDNRNGALKLLKRGGERVAKFQPKYFSIDVKRLVDSVAFQIAELERDSATEPMRIEIPRVEKIQVEKL